MIKRCLCRATKTPPPQVKGCSNCFYIPDLLLMSADSVAPCGETAEVDILENANISVCKTSNNEVLCPLKYEVVSYENYFDSKPVVSSTGMLSFTGNGLLTPGKYTDIGIKVTCPCKDLGTFVTVKLTFKNLCTSCEPGFICDPCTGDCVEAASDLGIQKTSITTLGSGLTIK